MTDAAESARTAPRHLVFTTTVADALALETILKPPDRGWRSVLGYAFALPPLIVVSWLTREAEWPVWFAAFGLAGVAAWQLARLVLRVERVRAARHHPVGAGQVEFSGDRLKGTIGGVVVDIPAAPDVRVETDAGHLHIVDDGQPALILPLSAFAGRADMAAFAAAFESAGQRTQSILGSD
ncbi:MAG: hypothetical protein H6Q99_2360 [Proteobacteria bacterium]|nr:hypothetical protein [Pseudomonadota bacterium]